MDLSEPFPTAQARSPATPVLRTTRSAGAAAARLRTSLSVAAGSTSNRRTSSMPSRWWKASAWNSLCAPLPISAMTLESLRASFLAAMTEVAAVRIAVVMVSSLSTVGMPVSTSARAPNAITVDRPCR